MQKKIMTGKISKKKNRRVPRGFKKTDALVNKMDRYYRALSYIYKVESEAIDIMIASTNAFIAKQ
ncbi:MULTISPECIES: hypothetical protein [unclassified Chitinophaga]|uniref:hypothetical protein n=1 Tax=unclassified Chitinophaga TaxID=2619133 RepID=UPI0009C9947A|nr:MULTISPECIES: hypothetical protein [unclassified Chitinophaga]OMP75805.1 hypothetical protein BW716_28270 [[Flexibacter] sp. ATCC 35208]WPV67871.1 hypothetical protein QQL36_03925 [Chitinophaga sp. LS1]